MVKSDVLSLLKNETVDVEFVKMDGNVRTLTCTLVESKLPTANNNPDQFNDEICIVFDLISQNWRRFRWDSLLNVNGVEFSE